MTAATKLKMTEAEYREFDRQSEIKHEFVDGEAWAMAGGTALHGLISVNVGTALNIALRGKPCRPYSSDVRVYVEATGNYFYPDVSVVCGALETLENDRQTVMNARVVVEVLSPSTAHYDKGKKWDNYFLIETLTDYVMVAQDEPKVTHYQRQESGKWTYEVLQGSDAVLLLESIDCKLPIAEFYEGADTDGH